LVDRKGLDAVSHADALLHHGSLVRMYPDISMVLLQAAVDRTASLPNAGLNHSQEIMHILRVLSPRSFLTPALGTKWESTALFGWVVVRTGI
jgi:hypothetical protein